MGTRADIHSGTKDGECTVRLCSYHGSGDAAAYLTAEDSNSPAVAQPGLGTCPLRHFQGGFHYLPDIHQP